MSDINTTKEGIVVVPGQVWRDLDKRCPNRRIVVLSVFEGRIKARCEGSKRIVKISIGRMHRHSTGFALEKA